MQTSGNSAALNMYKSVPIYEQAEEIVIFCDWKAAIKAIQKGKALFTNMICSLLKEIHK